MVSEFTVADEDRAAFEESFSASMRDTLVGVPGLQRSLLLRPGARTVDRGYLAVMEFDDEAACNTYVGSETFRHSHSGRKSISSGFTATQFDSVLELAG